MLNWLKVLPTLLVAGLACLECAAAPLGLIEGVLIDDTSVVSASELKLNGAAAIKRGYQKVAVVALYLKARADTSERVEAMPGAKRIRITVIKDVTGSMAARYFVNDFKNAATQEEFKQLIPFVGQIGSQYATVPLVRKGDVINLDWLPGQGMYVTYNGKEPGQLDGSKSNFMNSELLYKVHLRMYVSGNSEEVAANMLGKSNSLWTSLPK